MKLQGAEGDTETEPGEAPGALAVFRRLGATLRMVREQQGTSLANVARLSRTGKSQLSQYETGKALPKLESLARILDALDLDPLTVFYWATRLERGVSHADIQHEVLHAGMRYDKGSQPFQALLGAAFEAYRAYLEARMPGSQSREEMAR